MLSGLLIPPLLFFALGAIAQVFRSDLKFPNDLSRALSIYLLIGIGLHGGHELAGAAFSTAIQSIMAALVMGFGLPLVAYVALRRLCGIDALNAAAISAHYGSVSAGTFMTAVAFLQSREVTYESYPVIMLAIMEAPAIVVGLAIAQRARRLASASASIGPNGIGTALAQAVTHGSVVLLFGTMLIGAVVSEKSLDAINPFGAGFADAVHD